MERRKIRHECRSYFDIAISTWLLFDVAGSAINNKQSFAPEIPKETEKKRQRNQS